MEDIVFLPLPPGQEFSCKRGETMLKSARRRLAGLMAVGVLAGLLPTLVVSPSPAFASCGATRGRTFMSHFDSNIFDFVERWTGWNQPHPPGNGWVPREEPPWTGGPTPNPNFIETVDVSPGQFVEFGGEGISSTVRNGSGLPIKPAIYINQATFPNHFLPVPDSNCEVISWQNPFVLHPRAAPGIYTIFGSHVCAAHSATTNCQSIVYPIVRLNYRHSNPPIFPPAPLFIQQNVPL